MFSTLSSVLLFVAQVASDTLYAGVSESGGEFGVYGVPGTGLPGTYGVTYQFINEATVATFVSQSKINLFRVAFLLERMCPLEYGLGSRFNETHFDLYQQAIDFITIEKGAYALLDPHNYMRYNDPSSQPTSGSVIGNTSDPKAATTAQFEEFWEELAGRFRFNPKVIFGIMNEPHDMPTSLVLQNDQAAINGIRRAGATQLILAPGNGYTGGHSWFQYTCSDCEPSSEYLYQIKDPLRNTAIDIHEYLDYDFSGQHQACTQPAPSNLANLTTWLAQHNLKALVSEFGGDNNTMCAEYIRQEIEYIADNSEYIGWSAWAAGPLWGTNSPCCNDGAQYGSLEPGSTAAGGGPSLYETVWEPVIKPLVPVDKLKRFGVSTL